MRSRRLGLLALPTLLLSFAGCIIVIEDGDDEPGPGPRPPDAGRAPDAYYPYPDAGTDAATVVDAGSPFYEVETGCAPADVLGPNVLEISGDVARIDIEHGGGCGQHVYRICWDGAFLESFPVQTRLSVQHRGDDPCDAIIRETLLIDLGNLRDAYRRAYQTRSGTISVGFQESAVRGRYDF